jgi:hypothetical protein
VEIIVTDHSIEKYRKRTFKWHLSDKQIKMILTNIAKNGTIRARRPGNVWEVVHNGISIVVDITPNNIVVITCLGDRKYRNWAKKNEVIPRYAVRAMP